MDNFCRFFFKDRDTGGATLLPAPRSGFVLKKAGPVFKESGATPKEESALGGSELI